jgi:hypothetical protein
MSAQTTMTRRSSAAIPTLDETDAPYPSQAFSSDAEERATEALVSFHASFGTVEQSRLRTALAPLAEESRARHLGAGAMVALLRVLYVRIVMDSGADPRRAVLELNDVIHVALTTYFG